MEYIQYRLNQLYIRKISRFNEAQLALIDEHLQQLLLENNESLKKTHYFHGRYENIYVESEEFPLLQQLMQESLHNAAEILSMPQQDLKIGYWFNLMEPGQVTTLHRHDDLDELLSGVIYLKVPENSGNLVLIEGSEEIELVPVTGHYVYFDPATPHKVNKNRSNQRRLSIGMNIGSRTSEFDF